MEYVYRKEVPELPSVLKLFQMEQEKGRKDRRLKNFPKSLTHWRPEAGKMEPQCEKALTAISWRPTAHSHTLKSVPKWKKAALTWLLVHFQATSHEKTQHCVFSILWRRKTNLQWQSLELLNKSFSTLLHQRNSCGFLCYYMRGRSLIRSVVYGGHRRQCSRE